ncbi:uncharacterized protein LOC141640744 [Silene latifolia]|uniref:uncharacterized protein LOC141640744 n=1 Tax=Silene latifolia TaxID=37657 RepID=UPI003D783E15
MKDYYNEHGMLFRTSQVDTPQQNGRVERKHRHILEKARALRFQGNLPLEFWGECVLTAVYLINRTPTRLLNGLTPYEILYGEKPCLDNIRVFGSICYVHNKDKPKDKFNERGKRCIFLGYPHSKKGWKVYDLKKKQLFESRDVIFYEHVFPFVDAPITDHHETQVTQQRNTSSGPHVPIMDQPDLFYDSYDNHENEQEPLANEQEKNERTGTSNEQENETNEMERETEARDMEQVPREQVGRGAREKFEPYWKKDYICKSARIIDPAASAHSLQSTSTKKGTRYPMVNYVTTNCFSNNHRNYLAKVDAIEEPRSYKEVVKNSRVAASHVEGVSLRWKLTKLGQLLISQKAKDPLDADGFTK